MHVRRTSAETRRSLNLDWRRSKDARVRGFFEFLCGKAAVGCIRRMLALLRVTKKNSTWKTFHEERDIANSKKFTYLNKKQKKTYRFDRNHIDRVCKCFVLFPFFSIFDSLKKIQLPFTPNDNYEMMKLIDDASQNLWWISMNWYVIEAKQPAAPFVDFVTIFHCLKINRWRFGRICFDDVIWDLGIAWMPLRHICCRS